MNPFKTIFDFAVALVASLIYGVCIFVLGIAVIAVVVAICLVVLPFTTVSKILEFFLNTLESKGYYAAK